jgi:hypothetical protein
MLKLVRLDRLVTQKQKRQIASQIRIPAQDCGHFIAIENREGGIQKNHRGFRGPLAGFLAIARPDYVMSFTHNLTGKGFEGLTIHCRNQYGGHGTPPGFSS